MVCDHISCSRNRSNIPDRRQWYLEAEATDDPVDAALETV